MTEPIIAPSAYVHGFKPVFDIIRLYGTQSDSNVAPEYQGLDFVLKKSDFSDEEAYHTVHNEITIAVRNRLLKMKQDGTLDDFLKKVA